MACEQMESHLEHAQEAIYTTKVGTKSLKDKLIKTMETQWNGTFNLIGQSLLKKLWHC